MTVTIIIITFQTDIALGCVTVRRRISAHLSTFVRSSALGLCPFANKRRTHSRSDLRAERNTEIGRMNKRVARISKWISIIIQRAAAASSRCAHSIDDGGCGGPAAAGRAVYLARGA